MFDRDREAELTRHYEGLSDDRLLDSASKSDELTDLARELADAELRKRHLKVTSTPLVPASTGFDGEYGPGSDLSRGDRQLWYREPGDYAELAPPDCVFPIRDTDDIHAIRVSLALEGIPRDEFWPHKRADLRKPMLAVLPEDRDRAKAILSAPVTEQVREQMQEELDDPDDWLPPSCPACGEPDALLVSVIPVNAWRCEECGHRWVES